VAVPLLTKNRFGLGAQLCFANFVRISRYGVGIGERPKAQRELKMYLL
jgi:hypothetical protein